MVGWLDTTTTHTITLHSALTVPTNRMTKAGQKRFPHFANKKPQHFTKMPALPVVKERSEPLLLIIAHKRNRLNRAVNGSLAGEN